MTMCYMRFWLRSLLVFAFGAVWMALFQTWGAFADPDAFYHAKMASLLLERGPLLSFPWLDLTALHLHFHNQHFLFHYFLAPFVFFFGMLPGAQIAAVVAGGMFAVMAYYTFAFIKIRFAWFWTAILLALPPMSARLSLGKASPFAIGFFLLGIVCWKKSWHVSAFIICTIYALTHGGWLLLPGALFVLSLGDWLYDRFVLNQSSSLRLTVFFATLCGGIFGTCIHPNFPESISYLWIQIFQIGVATPIGRVMMGNEWYAYQPMDLVKHLALLIIIGLFILWCFLSAKRRAFDHEQARLSIGLGLLSAIFCALTLKSMRFVEYFAPVALLWFATIAQQIDERDVYLKLRERFRFMPHLLTVIFLFVIARTAMISRESLQSSAKPFTRFAGAMEVVSRELKPGERLFHSDWSMFPLLWTKNDQISYIAGLDPVFLLQASSTLSDAYTQLTLGHTTSGAYEIISQQFGSRVVLVSKKMSKKFEAILRNDDRFSVFYEDDEAIVFSVLN